MLSEADAECVSSQLKLWMADKSNWVKHATLLERRFPHDFGKNQTLEVTQRVSISITSPELSEAQQRLLLLALAASDQNLLPPGPIEDRPT